MKKLKANEREYDPEQDELDVLWLPRVLLLHGAQNAD
jgi:hypothetical protein